MTFTEIDPEGEIILNDLFKYTDNTLFEERYGISAQDIIDEINNLDKDKQFKYNYTVSEESKIEDPLLGKAFFENYHIFNKYAISEAILKAPLDKTVKNPSIISIINNR